MPLHPDCALMPRKMCPEVDLECVLKQCQDLSILKSRLIPFLNAFRVLRILLSPIS